MLTARSINLSVWPVSKALKPAFLLPVPTGASIPIHHHADARENDEHADYHREYPAELEAGHPIGDALDVLEAELDGDPEADEDDDKPPEDRPGAEAPPAPRLPDRRRGDWADLRAASLAI